MNELATILDYLATTPEPDAVLATIVGVSGSTYRLPGARMLILPDRRIGTISGGCLEKDVCRRALWLTRDGPTVVTYDTGDDDQAVGYTLGCRGAVTLLLERVFPMPEYLKCMHRCMASATVGAVATVVHVDNDPDFHIANRFFSQISEHESTCDSMPSQLAAEFARVASTHRSTLTTIPTALGGITAFIEPILPPVQLSIFGSGPDIDPVVAFATLLGWQVQVLAPRITASLRARIPAHCAVLAAAPETTRQHVRPGPRSAALVMTHHYESDQTLLSNLLSTDLFYLGVLGPRHRTESLLSDLGEASNLDACAHAHLFGPMGLNIGGDTPQSVALSIIAHIQAVLNDADARPLRDRIAPIHERARSAFHTPLKVRDIACGVGLSA